MVNKPLIEIVLTTYINDKPQWRTIEFVLIKNENRPDIKQVNLMPNEIKLPVCFPIGIYEYLVPDVHSHTNYLNDWKDLSKKVINLIKIEAMHDSWVAEPIDVIGIKPDNSYKWIVRKKRCY